ncbi:MAG TPA: ABC transporter permease [Bauldia sp.]|nr:ABC transporter permease [Bauldia sp.]
MNRALYDRVSGYLLRHAAAIIFIVVFVYFGLAADNFLSAENSLNIIKQASFTGVIAVGMTFVLLTAGIDLSVGSNMYVSAMTVGYLLQIPGLQGGFGVLAGIVAGLATGALFGAINAACIVYLRITPFLVTLATMVAGHGLVTAITQSFGLDYPAAFTSFGAASILGIPIPVAIFAAVVAAAHIVLTRTPFGRQLYAVGNDAEAARKAGIATDRIIFSVYVISGLCAALGGVTLIALVGRLNQTFGVGKEFDVITAAVLGGTSLFGGVGTAFGAVIGSVLVQMVQAGMVFVKVNLYLQPMVLAAVIFIAVFFDSLRGARLEKLKRRFIRMDAPNEPGASAGKEIANPP